ncbi:hypothetical protein CKAN_01624700 [Cinnamomum micranthum f. kanehirae]|uniref:Transmembrane protein n=1 Tax=Cinnamomum micranthum f. kanehirae TaxID=337451 RepID=A0A443P987_9MAGN|nr:hypothetical protein CKAN_01624700 [Cinnamomum micranthum f. kanehirae]
MQRQSLGSPASKLQIHVAKEQKLEGAENRKGEGGEEEDKKADNKLFKSTLRTHKSIHLIPLLIISCFLILYLVSHDPSQKGKSKSIIFINRSIDLSKSRHLISISCFSSFSCRFGEYRRFRRDFTSKRYRDSEIRSHSDEYRRLNLIGSDAW